MKENFDDLRIHKRYMHNVVTYLTIRTGRKYCNTVNVSKGGVCLETGYVLPLYEKGIIQIIHKEVQGQPQIIEGEFRVAWVTKIEETADKGFMGIEITKFNKGNDLIFHDLVKELGE